MSVYKHLYARVKVSTEYYRGWEMWEDLDRPVTGQWRAIRFGVTMNAATKEGLKSLIDQRIADDNMTWRQWREQGAATA